MNDDFDAWMMKHLDEAHEGRRELEEGFAKLCLDACAKVPKKGDRVVVAIGFLGMGHLWVRSEGLVLEAGDTSYKVQILDYKPFGAPLGSHVCWVHQALITDVLGG